MQLTQRHHLTPSILVVLVVVTLSAAAGIYCRITRDPYLTRGTSDVAVVTLTAKPLATYTNSEYGYTFKYPNEYVIRDLFAKNESNILSYVGVGSTTIESGLIFYVQVYSTKTTLSNVVKDIQTKWGVPESNVSPSARFAANGKTLTRELTEMEGGRVWHLFEREGFIFEMSYPIPHPTASGIPNIIDTFTF